MSVELQDLSSFGWILVFFCFSCCSNWKHWTNFTSTSIYWYSVPKHQSLVVFGGPHGSLAPPSSNHCFCRLRALKLALWNKLSNLLDNSFQCLVRTAFFEILDLTSSICEACKRKANLNDLPSLQLYCLNSHLRKSFNFSKCTIQLTIDILTLMLQLVAARTTDKYVKKLKKICKLCRKSIQIGINEKSNWYQRSSVSCTCQYKFRLNMSNERLNFWSRTFLSFSHGHCNPKWRILFKLFAWSLTFSPIL